MKYIYGFCLIMLFFSCATPRVTTLTEWENTPDEKWSLIPMPENTFCSDSSEYFIFSKKGTTDNLIIHFSGGGACWDGTTCGQPFNFWRGIKVGITHELDSYYIPTTSDKIPLFIGGLFSSKPKNPLHDWNVVYIPYCSADLHTGRTINTYPTATGDSLTIYHHGNYNVEAALDWVFKTYGEQKKVLITGDSAGGYAAMLYTTPIAQHFSAAKMYQLVDCSYALIEGWKTIAETWEADFLEAYKSYEEFLVGAYQINQEVAPITFLQISSVYDFILPQFRAKLRQDTTSKSTIIQQWSQEMLQLTQQFSASNMDYRYFITDHNYSKKKQDTPHAFISFNGPFFKCEQDGIALAEWIGQNVVEDTPFNVGEDFIRALETTDVNASSQLVKKQ